MLLHFFQLQKLILIIHEPCSIMMHANKTSSTESPRETSRPNSLSRSQQSMFDSMFALMSSQVEGLSGEVAEGSSSQMIGTGEPQPHLSVLGSTNPQTDCATILWLFPYKYSQIASPEALLLQERDNPTTGTTIMLIHSGVDLPMQWRNAILILEEIEISSAVNRCHNRAASVFHQENIEIARNQYTTFAVIRLTGGANLMLLTSTVIKSQLGRAALTDFVSSRELIESNEARGSSALREETWLDELEGEFSFRRSSLVSDKGRNSTSGSVPNGTAPFPSLKVSLQRKHGFLQRDIPINSKCSLTFETDLFVGKMLLFMKPSDPDDGIHKQFFHDTKASFILQIQGKFKYVPTGTLFGGIELSCDEIKPALVTKGLCGLLLKTIQAKHPNVHSSYGDSTEKPHIVVPAWTFFDRIVRTRPSDSPPIIEEPFFEPTGSVSARQNSGSNGAWNTIDTYSFSSFCSYMDFPSWQLVNISFCRESSLHNFWADSIVRLVLYEQRDNIDSMDHGRHKPAANSYLFSLELEHVIPETENPLEQDQKSELTEGAEVLPWGKVRAAASFGDSFGSDTSEGSDKKLSDDGVSMDRENDVAYLNEDQQLARPVNSSLPSRDLLCVVNSSCPAWFDMIAKDKKYTKVYAFREPKQSKTIFRTVQQFQVHIDTLDAMKYVTSVSSPRMSTSEETRRILGYTYFQGQLRQPPKVRQINASGNEADSLFLKRATPAIDSGKIKKAVIKCGYIARAISDYHWREEYVRLVDHYITFFHPERLKSHFRINLKSVIKGKKLLPEDAPDMPGYYFLELDTIGRKVYLMFLSEEMREEWTMAMNQIILRYRKTEITSNRLDGIDNPTEQFMHKSTMWNCEQRLLLNCRRFSFRSPKIQVNPAEMMEEALLLGYESRETGNESTMIRFLDKTSELKDVDLYTLQSDERVAFLVNLYHLMIMHSFILLGPAESSFTFVNMLHMVSYQISDDIFSLAELELNIIRGNMSYPVEFAPRFVLPKSRYGFALPKIDIRVNFSLNTGSVSAPHSVPIYKAMIIDMQLDAAAMVFLDTIKVYVDKYGISVTLPRLFLWYSEDFGSPIETMAKIAPYLNSRNQDALKLAGYKKRISFKFMPFDFQCRPLWIEDNRARKFQYSPVKSAVTATVATVTKTSADDDEQDDRFILELDSDAENGFVNEAEEEEEVSLNTQHDFVEVPM